MTSPAAKVLIKLYLETLVLAGAKTFLGKRVVLLLSTIAKVEDNPE
jgi:hypothetical protein